MPSLGNMAAADSPQVKKTIDVVSAIIWLPYLIPIIYHLFFLSNSEPAPSALLSQVSASNSSILGMTSTSTSGGPLSALSSGSSSLNGGDGVSAAESLISAGSAGDTSYFFFGLSNFMSIMFAVSVILTTSFTARYCNGDALMVVMAVIGALTELLSGGTMLMTNASSSSDVSISAHNMTSAAAPSSWCSSSSGQLTTALFGCPSAAGASGAFIDSKNVWFTACALHGLFAGILCKAKDIQDERYYEHYTVTERLYLVVPYTLGIWWAYVWIGGTAGLVAVFKSIFFCLALCGYGVLTHRILDWSGVYGMDLISLVNKVFTSSFGVIVSLGVGTFVVVSFLAMPFLTALLQLNGVVSVLGILVEIVVYDLA